jgi:hypothetical protein
MNTLSKWLASTVLLLVSLPMQAITLSVNPVTQTVMAGSSFDVALTISGLGNGIAPSISAFDLDVGYDPTVLGYSSDELEYEHRHTSDKRSADRLKAVYLLGSGWQVSQVAQALMIDRESVRNHHKRYRKGGLLGLLRHDAGGSEAALNSEQCQTGRLSANASLPDSQASGTLRSTDLECGL